MADKQIKDFIVTTELTDTMNIATEDVNLATPVTRRFSLTTLKSYILQNVSSAWASITGKPFTTIDSNTLDTTTVGEVVTLKVKDGIYANASDLTNKLTVDNFTQGNNITLDKNGNQITISSNASSDILKILGSYDTLELLQTAHTDGSAILGGYLVGTTTQEYYYWSTTSSPNGWISGGNLKGSDGTNGTSPTVTVGTNNTTTYTLNITDVNGTITTVNLKGVSGTMVDNTLSGSTQSITLADNIRYLCSTLTSLSLIIPSGNAKCAIKFISDTSMTFSIGTGNKFIGTDCYNNIFTPLANQVYELNVDIINGVAYIVVARWS